MRSGRPPVAFALPFVLTALLWIPPSAFAQSFCDFAPRVGILSSARVAVGVQGVIEVTATDPNGDAILSLTADNSGLPAGNNAAFTTNSSNTSGTLTWTPQTGQTGSYPISFTAANALSGTASGNLSVIDTGGAPFVQCPSIATTGEFRELTFHVAAGDPDGEQIISLTAAGTAITGGATFTVNATNTAGTFDWTPNFTQAGSWNVAFTATSSTSASYNTAITVTSADRAPVVLVPPSAAGVEGSLLTICAQAADPDGDAITMFTASPLPAGATFTSSASHLAGTFSWTPSTGQAGSYTVNFCASNALTDCASVAITIQSTGDHPPVVTAPASVTGLTGSLITFNVTASDPDGDPISSLTAASLPAGASFLPNFDNTVGTFSWTPTDAQAGTWFVAFSATANGLTATATTAISVVANLSARIFTTGGDKTLHLGSGKSTWCLAIEPIGSWNASDISLPTVRLQSPGTGSVSEIAPIPGKGGVLEDSDRNGVLDLTVCFQKTDLRQLFSNLTGRQTVTVTVRGTTVLGQPFAGTMDLDVAAGGNLAASITPNPPNPEATLRFVTSQKGAYRVRVFDVRGRLVRTLGGDDRSAGEHAVRFDGRGDSGQPLPSGIYLFRIETPDGEITAKTAILR